MEYYIGIMSGTSIDGIDAVLLEINALASETICKVIGHIFFPMPDDLYKKLSILQKNTLCSLSLLGDADNHLAKCYTATTKNLLNKLQIDSQIIQAIGCHGQTLFHQPTIENPFTIQIGDPNWLAEHTGIPVVTDFRRMDMACNGDGAPLAPLFHQLLFANQCETRGILNLGGIANITILNPRNSITGFDIGPANCLMDGWIHQHFPSHKFDDNGQWAASGTVNYNLLNQMLNDNYFHRNAPKSTGKELFNQQWLKTHLQKYPNLKSQDVQATLCELTASCICKDINQYIPKFTAIYICGGGARNQNLIKRIKNLLPEYYLHITDDLGIPADQVEAAAFAWLAYCRIKKKPGNIPSVTGANKQTILGGVYLPSNYLH